MASSFITPPIAVADNLFLRSKRPNPFLKVHASLSESESPPSFTSSAPGPYALQPPVEKIEKRGGKKVGREEKKREMEKREPPNFEIGWKRTKSIETTKPKGFTVADYLKKLEELMGIAWECNCSDCSMRGNTHFIVPWSKFKLLGDSEHYLTTYTFGTRMAKHMFCKICGITSFYVPRSNPDGIAVTYKCVDPGTLEHVEIRLFDGKNWERSHEQTSIGRFLKSDQ